MILVLGVVFGVLGAVGGIGSKIASAETSTFPKECASAWLGIPCDGFSTAGAEPFTPGFPDAGYGGSALNNIFLLAALGLIASIGLLYITRPQHDKF